MHLGVNSGLYSKLLHRMAESNMIVYYEPRDDVIENSLFGVWKEVGVSQRLIWGGNRCNPLFRPEASYVESATLGLLADLHLPLSERLYLFGCDILQYYIRLKAPDFLVLFLELPRVLSSQVSRTTRTEYVLPYLQCILMGASFAVHLAQAASLSILRRSRLQYPHLRGRRQICTLTGAKGGPWRILTI